MLIQKEFNKGDEVFFIDEKTKQIFWGKITYILRNYDANLPRWYNIEVTCTCFGNIINVLTFNEVPDKLVFKTEEDAKIVLDELIKLDTINVELEYNVKELKSLIETLYLSRSLISKYIYENETDYGIQHLNALDRLIDSLALELQEHE